MATKRWRTTKKRRAAPKRKGATKRRRRSNPGPARAATARPPALDLKERGKALGGGQKLYDVRLVHGRQNMDVGYVTAPNKTAARAKAARALRSKLR